MLRRELLLGGLALSVPGRGFAAPQGAPGQAVQLDSHGRPIWGEPYTHREILEAEQRFGLWFPPDLVDLFLKHRLAQGFDWTHDEAGIREMLDWPFSAFVTDVENNGVWPAFWGPKPTTAEARAAVIRKLLARAPKLIPIAPYRFVPETPHRTGNPVFFLFLTDVRLVGANLQDFVEREYGLEPRGTPMPAARRIPFWSQMSTLKPPPPPKGFFPSR